MDAIWMRLIGDFLCLRDFRALRCVFRKATRSRCQVDLLLGPDVKDVVTWLQWTGLRRDSVHHVHAQTGTEFVLHDLRCFKNLANLTINGMRIAFDSIKIGSCYRMPEVEDLTIMQAEDWAFHGAGSFVQSSVLKRLKWDVGHHETKGIYVHTPHLAQLHVVSQKSLRLLRYFAECKQLGVLILETGLTEFMSHFRELVDSFISTPPMPHVHTLIIRGSVNFSNLLMNLVLPKLRMCLLV